MGNFFGYSTPDNGYTNRESGSIFSAPTVYRTPSSWTQSSISKNRSSVQYEVRSSSYANGYQANANTYRARDVYRDNEIESTRRRKQISKENFCKPQLVTKNNLSFIVDNIYNESATFNWDYGDYSVRRVYFIELDEYSDEYQEIKSLFCNTNKKFFKVTKIERIQNPYLLAAFLLKKQECESKGTYQNIQKLFHGTKREYVKDICTENLDWRLYGKNKGNKFGQGVSFTPISYYATFYGDEERDGRVMLVVNVLVGSACIGTPNMILPPSGIDTSVKENNHVVVKYEDSEFYPAYKITYSCTNNQELIKRQHIRRQEILRKQKNKNVTYQMEDNYYYDD